MDECRVEDPLQLKLLIQRLRHPHDLIITFRRRPNNHLGALPRRDKSWSMAIERELLAVLFSLLLDITHGSQNILSALVRRQPMKTLCCRKFHIDTHPVCQKSSHSDQILGGSRNRLHMNISLKPIFPPKPQQRLIDQAHRVIRALPDTGT